MYFFGTEYKALCLRQIHHKTSLSTTLHIFKHGGGCIMFWVCLSLARTRVFFRIKIIGVKLSTGKILEENLVQFAFQQTLVDKFTFQQENNLKHKAKYTLELLTTVTLNVPEWPSCSFDLYRIENLWQD